MWWRSIHCISISYDINHSAASRVSFPHWMLLIIVMEWLGMGIKVYFNFSLIGCKSIFDISFRSRVTPCPGLRLCVFLRVRACKNIRVWREPEAFIIQIFDSIHFIAPANERNYYQFDAIARPSAAIICISTLSVLPLPPESYTESFKT